MTISFNNLGNYGHLGNQMFQYSCLISLAKGLDTFAICPLGFQGGSKSRLMDCFKLGFATDGYNTVVNDTYTESGFSFHPGIFETVKGSNWDIRGYFQSEKYFKHNESLVRSEFLFRDDVVESCKDSKVDPSNKIAIHIRRGDYVNLGDVHPFPSKGYYKKAMEMFPGREFLIFSDDIEWCRKSDIFFGEEKNGYFFSRGNQYQDMYLMSQCDGHIIANSSFSWWGAWLANKEKVIAPKTWFGSKGPQEWKDVYCKGWTVL